MYESAIPRRQYARLPCPSSSPRACSTHVHWVGDAIQPFCPLLSPSPPAFNLSHHQGLFQWVGSSHQVAKILELHINPSNEYSGLISFRIDWFDLLANRGTLKSFLQDLYVYPVSWADLPGSPTRGASSTPFYKQDNIASDGYPGQGSRPGLESQLCGNWGKLWPSLAASF